MGDTGIIDQNVDLSKPGMRGINHRRHTRAIRHIGLYRMGGIAQLFSQFFRHRQIDISNHNPRAFACEFTHDPSPETRGPSGDNGNLVVQTHVFPP